MILRLSTNITSFIVLNGYSIMGNEELSILNSWVQEFLYNLNFGFSHNDQIILGLISTFPIIVDTIFRYWIFHYLNYVSPSFVVIYHLMND
ncbi:hypothetical protein ACJRO7_003919 [Eucalyptus globulus]|uniref:Chloroplast envelope membrane protein n=1 Tax=Eucalyptus globulus TaxID=34317 RepID=A0ABD3IZC9_EUCGL